ncbi:hypothetical protein FJT64_003562 [Amphibalanus amphitrite]|uniref:Uncharacterized protein n=1 Tax=Amphibalanus amphitrite TaxID=1232801 RepID=A0A6A4VYD5_AMPAM|nr:hypothetical protein FJT64_003562 [Amphibalanus amphitrite]
MHPRSSRVSPARAVRPPPALAQILSLAAGAAARDGGSRDPDGGRVTGGRRRTATFQGRGSHRPADNPPARTGGVRTNHGVTGLAAAGSRSQHSPPERHTPEKEYKVKMPRVPSPPGGLRSTPASQLPGPATRPLQPAVCPPGRRRSCKWRTGDNSGRAPSPLRNSDAAAAVRAAAARRSQRVAVVGGTSAPTRRLRGRTEPAGWATGPATGH